jgi:hypothetical protein
VFRQTYPFSPTFVQTLVASSSALQRERAALRIMLQLLVDRRDSLRLGDLVPVGDLWDAVAGSEDAFSDVLLGKVRHARKLYQQKLRPILEEEPEKLVANDRIVKTLLPPDRRASEGRGAGAGRAASPRGAAAAVRAVGWATAPGPATGRRRTRWRDTR